MDRARHGSTHKQPDIATATALSGIGYSSWLTPARHDQAELLDQGAGSLSDVRVSLHDIWRLNQLFGGNRALTRHLYPRLRRADQLVRVADLGTGAGKLALHLLKWADRHGIVLYQVPLDFSARHLSIAQETVGDERPIHLIQADALALPFAADHIDYFISSLFMHHFDPPSLIDLLHCTYQLARRGIIMTDIVRADVPIVAYRLIASVFPLNPLTRQDGMTSLKRAYTPAELLTMARAAELPHARVIRDPFYNMTLIAEKAHV